MKSLYTALLCPFLLAFVACNSQNKNKETPKSAVEVTQKTVTFSDFKKIKGVDNVQEVPFQVFTKLDSIQLFTAPRKDAPQLKIGNDKFNNYYGFEEFDDFYAIHFSIANNISNSIEAFVLKSEFTAAFDLTLEGADLYEIRSSTIKNVDNFNDKSFAIYGSINEVSEQEFNTAAKNRIDEVLVKNPHIKLVNENWVYSLGGDQLIITQHENVSTEEGPLSNEYIGQSAHLKLEIFCENSVDVVDSYYSFYDLETAAEFALFTSGYPQIVPSKNWISSITSNNSVGSDFVISEYLPAKQNSEPLLYINFTNFKIANEKAAFWADDHTFYAEVYPLNSAPAKGKKQKAAFIKIQVKANLSIAKEAMH